MFVYDQIELFLRKIQRATHDTASSTIFAYISRDFLIIERFLPKFQDFLIYRISRVLQDHVHGNPRYWEPT